MLIFFLFIDPSDLGIDVTEDANVQTVSFLLYANLLLYVIFLLILGCKLATSA